MKILVINGSPKGKYSITLQTCNYLQILHPEHDFEILHAGQSIKALEKDFSPAIAAVERADHKFYKSHGQYDFPQKQWPRMIAMYAVGTMLANPKLKSKLGNRMNEGMLMPYAKVMEQAKARVKTTVK